MFTFIIPNRMTFVLCVLGYVYMYTCIINKLGSPDTTRLNFESPVSSSSIILSHSSLRPTRSQKFPSLPVFGFGFWYSSCAPNRPLSCCLYIFILITFTRVSAFFVFADDKSLFSETLDFADVTWTFPAAKKKRF